MLSWTSQAIATLRLPQTCRVHILTGILHDRHTISYADMASCYSAEKCVIQHYVYNPNLHRCVEKHSSDLKQGPRRYDIAWPRAQGNWPTLWRPARRR
ncbi:hypothetical protein AAMO2058_000793300 [Amorphochlora amoebiformis]